MGDLKDGLSPSGVTWFDNACIVWKVADRRNKSLAENFPKNTWIQASSTLS